MKQLALRLSKAATILLELCHILGVPLYCLKCLLDFEGFYPEVVFLLQCNLQMQNMIYWAKMYNVKNCEDKCILLVSKLEYGDN